MTLHLHNTYSRRKEAFDPIDPANVRMYVCGPTVYDDIHIGNARPLVVFDVLARLLRHLYGENAVTYARNITDVDDKIIDRAVENGEKIEDLTARTAANFHVAAAAIGCLPPDIEPRATDHIPQMIALIENLIAKEHAYVAEGHVLFSVPSMPDYGHLSGRNRDEMIAGARVEVAPYKQDPADFVLWKPSTDDQPGWESPWGRGRPGWHLECSAMSEQHLGASFDIHGGGVDLVFPHHENEIAQSRCAHPDEGFAGYWVHNGYLMSEGEKMSKSLGNFYTVSDLLEEFPGEALRLAILKTHYRQPLDFTKDGVRDAKSELDYLYGALAGYTADELANFDWPLVSNEPVVDALSDDLNSPRVLVHLHAMAKAIYEHGPSESDEDILERKKILRWEAGILGLLQQDPEEWSKQFADEFERQTVDELIIVRANARSERDFEKADRIRDFLEANNVILHDQNGGSTSWTNTAPMASSFSSIAASEFGLNDNGDPSESTIAPSEKDSSSDESDQ